MPQLGFAKEFADMVADGTKRQTIRAPRRDKQHPKAGDTLYLKAGPYTSARRDLGTVICTSVSRISIYGVEDFASVWQDSEVRVNNRPVDIDEMAAADGFKSASRMLEYFDDHGGLPFDGFLIEWEEKPTPRKGK